MAYVITQNCCNDAACVPVCPVNCIHPTPDEPEYGTAEMLYIDPDVCIDCGACVDVCPVEAIHPDFDLPEEFSRYEDLNAEWFRDPAHQDYPRSPGSSASRTWEGGPDGPLKVAIVGSGPAAVYVAQELLQQRGLDVRVDVFERLPTPWGLVRSGVAPDHQETKATAEGFARTARRPELRLFLNVEVGTGLSHAELTARYHAVVYAVGASSDRGLGVPGEHLPGSHAATDFVAWYNGHPDFADRAFDLSGERAVVIGNGNVALDVARILLQDAEALARTDVADHALEQLRRSAVREVVVVGRRGPAQAAFTTPELLGLSDVEGVDLLVLPDEIEIDGATAETLGEAEGSIPLYKARLIAELGSRPPSAQRRVLLRFLHSPSEIVGQDRVEAVRLARNDLVVGDRGTVVAASTDEIEEIPCGLVLRAVGYKGAPVPELPFEQGRGVVHNVDGRVTDPETSEPLQGVYVAGWIKRGPTGVIGTNKQCAKQTVSCLLDDWRSRRLATPTQDRDVAELLPDSVDLSGWQAIDRHERAAGRAASRPRVKVVDRIALLQIAAAQTV